MHIDIISDVICPWCFVGKRRLERALAARSELDAEIAWRPFQLNPEMPREGMDRQSYMIAKFGSAARAAHVYAEIVKAGNDEGIDFAFERIVRTPNTVDAHRLIRLAGEHGVQDAVVELLFRRYFGEGLDVGDRERLVEIGDAGGLEADAVRAYLESDRDVDAVLREDMQARRLGVNGVPCFIVDRRYAVSGAQSPEVFHRVFDAAEQAGAAA